MSTHNICFYGEVWKIIHKLSSNTHIILIFVKWLRFTEKDFQMAPNLLIVNLTLQSSFSCEASGGA